MHPNEKSLCILEQTSLPRILVYLLKGSASQTDLNNNISASQGPGCDPNSDPQPTPLDASQITTAETQRAPIQDSSGASTI
jgi:hypothetical protein